MTWLQRYRVRSFLRDSIVTVPLLGTVAAMVAVRICVRIDERMGWSSEWQPDTVRMVLVTLGSSLFTFVVFVSSLLLVAVQIASAQLTPRVVSFLFREP